MANVNTTAKRWCCVADFDDIAIISTCNGHNILTNTILAGQIFSMFYLQK